MLNYKKASREYSWLSGTQVNTTREQTYTTRSETSTRSGCSCVRKKCFFCFKGDTEKAAKWLRRQRQILAHTQNLIQRCSRWIKDKVRKRKNQRRKKWKMYVKVKPDTPCHTPILLCTTQCCFNVISFVFVGTSRDKKERAIDCVHDLSSVAIIEL